METTYFSNPQDYIIQNIIDISHEYRVLILFNQVIAVAAKTHKDNKLRIVKITKNISTDHLKLSLKVAQLLRADFIGIDLAIDKFGDPYIIESNLSPQFIRVFETTQINPVPIIYQKALS